MEEWWAEMRALDCAHSTAPKDVRSGSVRDTDIELREEIGVTEVAKRREVAMYLGVGGDRRICCRGGKS